MQRSDNKHRKERGAMLRHELNRSMLRAASDLLVQTGYP